MYFLSLDTVLDTAQSIDRKMKRNNPRFMGLFERLNVCILVLGRSTYEKRSISGNHQRRDSSTVS
jgi:hypothetical protein